MKTAVALAQKIYKDPENNWLLHLEEINLHVIFRPVYSSNFNIDTLNKIVSLVIYLMITIARGLTQEKIGEKINCQS